MLQPSIRTFVLADLKCYMCGATAGSIERERDSSTPRVAIERGGHRRAYPYDGVVGDVPVALPALRRIGLHRSG